MSDEINNTKRIGNIRVITWNIACGANGYHQPALDGMAELLNCLRPDIVLLQEVDRNCARSSRLDVASEIAQRTGLQYHFTPAKPEDGGEFGNAVLAQSIVQRLDLPLGPEDGDPHNWETEPRSACAVIAQFGREPFAYKLACASTHLASNAAKPSLVRLNQVENLVNGMRGIQAYRHIIGGDFNIENPSPDLASLTIAYASVADRVGPTCSLAGPEGLCWGIDHVWVEQPMELRLARKIARPELSDHCLVMVDLFPFENLLNKSTFISGC